MKMHDNETVPEENVPILAKVQYGDRIVSAVGIYAVVKHQNNVGETTEITEMFVCDCGGMMFQWEDVIQWTILSEAAPDYSYRYQEQNKRQHAMLQRVADEWTSYEFKRAQNLLAEKG